MIATSGFLIAPECTKILFSRGSAPDHAGGGYDVPSDALVGWGGGPHSSPLSLSVQYFSDLLIYSLVIRIFCCSNSIMEFIIIIIIIINGIYIALSSQVAMQLGNGAAIYIA